MDTTGGAGLAMSRLKTRNMLAALGMAGCLMALTVGAVVGMRYVSDWPIAPAVAVSMVTVALLVAGVRGLLSALDNWIDRADAGPQRPDRQ